ncbi:MAG: rod shape-determining protein RodA [Candidatus Methylomirabilales bacterium]
MYFDRRLFTNFDWRIAITAVLLVSLGILAMYASNVGATSPAKQGLYLKQALWLLAGLGGLVVASVINYRTVARFAYLFYGLCFALLLIVDLLGHAGLGPQRWVKIGFVTIQPSEFMKLGVIVCLARYFEEYKERLGDPRLLLVPALLALVPALVILKQPDLGTAVTLIMIATTLLLLAGLRFKHLLVLGATGLSLLPLLWTFLKEYQRRRILVFLNPQLDPLGAGYHVAQSKIAVGSGELFGKGLTAASQSQLNFLPASHTDFIFAVLAEQWGFLGCVVILFLYYLLIAQGFQVASEAKDLFGSLMAFGVMAMIALQLFLNVGMVIGIMPVVGLPLPLLSYGGSSLVMTMLGLGLVISVRTHRFIY